MALVACGGSGDDTTTPDTTPNPNNDTVIDPNAPPAPSTALTVSFTYPAVQIIQGSATTIDVVAQNISGTATYDLIVGPAGMTIDSATGQISWTPATINFGADTLTSFTVSVTDDLGTVTETGTVTVVDSSANMPITRSNASTPTKPKSIHIADFDGIGGNEVLVTDNKSLLYTLKWNGSDFIQEWVYPFSFGNQANIDAIDTDDIDGDGREDIVVLNGNTVTYINGASRSATHSFEISAAMAGYSIAIADIDNDSVKEIITLTSVDTDSEQINIFSLPNPITSSKFLVEDWASSAANYGQAMVVTSVDAADVQLEIVTSNGYVIDGISLTDEWTTAKPANGFGDNIIAADLDGDNIDEIVGLRTDTGVIEVYSPQHLSDLFGSLNSASEPESTRCSIAAYDMDGNGADEVYAGICLDGGASPATPVSESLVLMTAETEASFTKYYWDRPINNATVFYDDRLHGGFSSLAIGDVNGDGNMDAVWGNKFSDGNQYTSITALSLGTNVVSNYAASANVLAQNMVLGLFDHGFSGAVDFEITTGNSYATFMSITETSEKFLDADTEFAMASRAIFLDYSGGMNLSSELSLTDTTVPLDKVMAADLLGNNRDQLVFSNGYITGTADEWSSAAIFDFNQMLASATDRHAGWEPVSGIFVGSLLAPDLPTAFDLADMDGNGDLEYIGYTGNYLFYYDMLGLVTPDLKWQSIRIEGNPIDVLASDLDNDASMDLVHLTDTALYIRKKDLDALHAGSPFYDTVFLFNSIFQGAAFSAVQVIDINSDSNQEIAVSASISDTNSVVYILDNSGTQITQFNLDGSVTDMQLGPAGNTLLVAWHQPGDDSRIARSYISELSFSTDMLTAVESLRSPALLGAVSSNSMNYGPLGQLLIGSEYGMYITQ